MSDMDISLKSRFIVFKAGLEMYALDISIVNEVIRLPSIVEVPDTRKHVKGIINLRGKIVPVISVRERFGMEETSLTKKSRVIIVKPFDFEAGLLVDEVYQVVNPKPDEFAPFEEELTQNSENFFLSILKSEKGVIGILNADAVIGESATD